MIKPDTLVIDDWYTPNLVGACIAYYERHGRKVKHIVAPKTSRVERRLALKESDKVIDKRKND